MNLVFDIGGMSTKIAIFEKGKIINKWSINYKSISIFNLIKMLNREIQNVKLNNNIDNICISSPGTVDTNTGEISSLSAIKNLNRINLKLYFENKFSIFTFIENDANCAALAELNFGNAKFCNNGFLFVIGTGIGGAVIINNNLYKGINLTAGDFGYAIENIKNKKSENFSMIAGMHSLEQKYLSLSKIYKTAEQIYNEYNLNKNAKKLIDNQINSIAKHIFNFSIVINPDTILIGGAVSKNENFIRLLNSKLKNYERISNLKMNLKIIQCKYFNDANLIGANYLAKI